MDSYTQSPASPQKTHFLLIIPTILIVFGLLSTWIGANTTLVNLNFTGLNVLNLALSNIQKGTVTFQALSIFSIPFILIPNALALLGVRFRVVYIIDAVVGVIGLVYFYTLFTTDNNPSPAWGIGLYATLAGMIISTILAVILLFVDNSQRSISYESSN